MFAVHRESSPPDLDDFHAQTWHGKIIGYKDTNFRKWVLTVKFNNNNNNNNNNNELLRIINEHDYLQITFNPERIKALTTFYKVIYELCTRGIMSLLSETSGTAFHKREV